MQKVKALQDNLYRINKSVDVIIFQSELTRENIPLIFSGCDIIVEAFDLAEMKEMLAETVQKQMPGIILIIGSGMAGYGNNESIQTRKIDDYLYVCGDESSEVSDEIPPMAPRVGIVANMQANVVIDILMSRQK
jgi:sulfur carrier protein ThiS adenylyltransferase